MTLSLVCESWRARKQENSIKFRFPVIFTYKQSIYTSLFRLQENMSKNETSTRTSNEFLNVDFMRSLVKQYSELGQWTSAFFWADAAAAAGGGDQASGDDIWLLASTMLARGELHRAAHAVVSRELHRSHLLCLGVAMRAYLAAKEPATALSLLEECDPSLMEPRTTDQTHNRALAGVLVSQARALSALERREAGAGALAAALRADAACYEALHLLLQQHARPTQQESELIDSLPISSQLAPAEAALVRGAYKARLQRYAPLPKTPPPVSECPITAAAEEVRSRTAEAAISLARRLAAACRWKEALSTLDSLDPWCCAEVRAACLLELNNSSQLFVFAHELVNAYPNSWTAWFAVGCYYYLIGKSEFARRYLSKAKSIEPGAGCVWLAYGHSFAADNEHDQAMAAYFKASQLMPGCHLPPLYVGVECSLLYNTSMAQRFLLRAALLHNSVEAEPESEDSGGSESALGWERILRCVTCPHAAHEAAAAALAAQRVGKARRLWLRAKQLAEDQGPLHPRWAATYDALGHVSRKQGRYEEALQWHEKALSIRPGHAPTYSAMGLCLALNGQEAKAADALHTALSKDPDDAVALALLDFIVEALDAQLDEEDIPQFPFPAVSIAPPPAPPAPAPATPGPGGDNTNVSDMSMSFD
ncbi:cell division cycle protein 16 homolog isoform X2 [Plutella xylostella]|uniref:cell division cycle protein 16 homolog isoform X1 n=1 Tax=Plutella xylostella TaxID=51655 RepID=UPI0020324B3D|nr:cell division cycle protein 16 homolog isoform X1 [Plutella xylostella]XP_048477828.1 cell division cycle protein 16 homolog isoform X2 [Plutella xylostella]